MNQRYASDAVVKDGQFEPPFPMDAELHYRPTTWPGARLPHVCVFTQAGDKISTLDLAGKGAFSLLTGIGGEAWQDAAAIVAAKFGLMVNAHLIGPHRSVQDHTGDGPRVRGIRDSGCILVRPDHHVAWRSDEMVKDPTGELRRGLSAILQPGEA